jgi:hypothetical protein
MILDIIHRPVFNLKHDVSETGFCALPQVEPAQLCLIDLKTEAEPSLRNVVP